MIAYLWFIVFCQEELELALERIRLLLCSSRILLACVRFLSSWECRLFGGPSSCQSLHPKLRGRRLETLRSWSQAVVFPKGPRLSSALCSSQPLGISPLCEGSCGLRHYSRRLS